MKFVMTQAVCPEGMQLLDGIADVYVADNQDPNNYLDEMKDADALIAVSYTHLDVYKRQCQYHIEAGRTADVHLQ